MESPSTVNISRGLTDAERETAARMYWNAFRGKLGSILQPETTALRFLARTIQSEFAIAARNAEGRLLGVAGYKTRDGAFLGGNFRHLADHYGIPGAIWRGALLGILRRKIQPGILLMDGIFVTEEARGQGVGRALLEAIKQAARELGCQSVRLDVIDTNVRARALYEREGFVATAQIRLGPLRHIFGFAAATTMLAPV